MKVNKIADRKGIAKRIRQLRGPLSQEKFAEKLGIQRGSIASLELGTLPGPDFLLILSEKCGVSIEWILKGEPATAADRVKEAEGDYLQDDQVRRVLKVAGDLTPDEMEDLIEYSKLIKRRRKSKNP